MTEAHVVELQKLYKKHEILKIFHHVLMWTGVILYFGILVFNLLTSFVRGHLRFYLGLVTVSFGFPMLIIRKRMENINNRIKEIRSMYNT